MNFSHPLDTYFRNHPDFDDADLAREAIQLAQRQDAIAGSLVGETSADYVLDVLESQGIDPKAYVDCVESNVQHLINNRATIAGLPIGFFL